ncbi:MAG: hypothetical protein ACJ75J_18240 [Cytophagaceae bacterium]|jgi:hypothetical protein
MKITLLLFTFLLSGFASFGQNKTLYQLRMDTTAIRTFSLKARGNLTITEDLINKNDRVRLTVNRGGRAIANLNYPSISIFNKSRVGTKLRTLTQVKDTVIIEVTRSADKTELIMNVPVVD